VTTTVRQYPSPRDLKPKLTTLRRNQFIEIVQAFFTSGSAMTAISPVQILAELEQAVAICPPERCARILSGIVRLLSASGDRPQELLVNVVDGILLRLTERATPNTLFQLSITLSELTVAPKETLQRLALHEDPAVAGPVLRGSQALSP